MDGSEKAEAVTTPAAARPPLLEEEGRESFLSPPFQGGVPAKPAGWFNPSLLPSFPRRGAGAAGGVVEAEPHHITP